MIKINKETNKRDDILAQAQSGTGKTGCFVIGTLGLPSPCFVVHVVVETVGFYHQIEPCNVFYILGYI